MRREVAPYPQECLPCVYRNRATGFVAQPSSRIDRRRPPGARPGSLGCRCRYACRHRRRGASRLARRSRQPRRGRRACDGVIHTASTTTSRSSRPTARWTGALSKRSRGNRRLRRLLIVTSHRAADTGPVGDRGHRGACQPPHDSPRFGAAAFACSPRRARSVVVCRRCMATATTALCRW